MCSSGCLWEIQMHGEFVCNLVGIKNAVIQRQTQVQAKELQ